MLLSRCREVTSLSRWKSGQTRTTIGNQLDKSCRALLLKGARRSRRSRRVCQGHRYASNLLHIAFHRETRLQGESATCLVVVEEVLPERRTCIHSNRARSQYLPICVIELKGKLPNAIGIVIASQRHYEIRRLPDRRARGNCHCCGSNGKRLTERLFVRECQSEGNGASRSACLKRQGGLSVISRGLRAALNVHLKLTATG